MGLAVVQRHLGEWISASAKAEKSPPRLTVTIGVGELPAGWERRDHHARTWAAVFGLLCIAPFSLLLAAAILRGAGIAEPYALISNSEIAIVAGTISLFFGIPVAIAVNLWRISRIGIKRDGGVLEGLLALEFAPFHLIVVAGALLLAALFVGHLAADTLACVDGVKSAC